MNVSLPAHVRRSVILALTVFTGSYALVASFVFPTAGVSNVVGIGVFTAGALLGSPGRGETMGRARAVAVLAAALAIPWLGSVALDPVHGSFTTGAWYISGVVCLSIQLLAQRHLGLCAVAMGGLVVQTLVWAGPAGLISYDVITVMTLVAMIIAVGRAVGRSSADLDRASTDQRARAELQVAQRAYHTQRETRLLNTQAMAARMLTRIAEGGMTEAERAECLVLHQAIRDEIRGRRLLNDAMREQLILHRRRGAFVQLMDDGGLDDLPHELVEPMLDRIAAALDGVLSDRIVVRTMPADSPKAVSVLASSSDPVAAALGLDDEGEVDLWLELDRPERVPA